MPAFASEIGYQIYKLLNMPDCQYGTIISVEQEGKTDKIVLEFTIRGLSQYRVYPINNNETIKIIIENNRLPVVIPQREDFPCTPHQNVDADGVFSLCLFDQTYEELKSDLDGSMLLQKINYWFCKTARNELHQASQPLEPYFSSVADFIVLYFYPDETRLTFLQKGHNDGVNFYIQRERYQQQHVIALRINLLLKAEHDNIMKKLPDNLEELKNYFSDEEILTSIQQQLVYIFSLGNQHSKIYRDYYGVSLSNMLKAKCLFTMCLDVEVAGSETRNRIDLRTMLTEKNVRDLLPLLGLYNDKNVIKVGSQDNVTLNEIKLVHFNTHFAFDQFIGHMYGDPFLTGVKPNDLNIMLIGTGAIGSQLLDNCARNGYGTWQLIDNDIYLPHNTARHKLDCTDYGRYKAELLDIWLRHLYHDYGRPNGYFPIDVLDDKNSAQMKSLFAGSDIVVDTAASPAVSKKLAIDYKHDKRIISFFMNPAGNAGVALIEDKKRNYRLDTLELDYFKALAENEKYSNHFDRQDAVYYSNSCRSKSGVIAQDSVAAFSALFSKKLKRAASKDNAEIVIWTEDKDTYTADSYLPSNYEAVEVISGGTNWQISISDSVKNNMVNARAACKTTETGGLLIGSVDKYRKILYIVMDFPCPDDSIKRPTSYIRGVKGLSEKMTQLTARTAGRLYYLGEWHSHPGISTAKSNDDKILHSSLIQYNSNFCLPAIMIIIGGKGMSYYLE